MFGKRKLDVVVVGAGPVGLFAALTMARRGARLQIVDKSWRPGTHSYALALHAPSLQLLQEVGVLPRVVEKGYEVQRIAIYEGADRKAEVRLPRGHDDLPPLLVLRQDLLEAALEEALAERGVHVLWNHEASQLALHSDKVGLTIDKLQKDSVGYAVAHTEWTIARTMEWEASWVIGADGQDSCVRRSAGIEFPAVADPLSYAVFEFQSDVDLDHEMRVVLGERTADVLWPLPGRVCRWGFEVPGLAVPAESRVKDRLAVSFGGAELPLLGADSLRGLIAERAPWFSGAIGEVHWRVAVRFERRLAEAFGKGRVALVGDAAHVCGPVGMHSMNVGLREARDLAELAGEGGAGNALDERLAAYSARGAARWRPLLGLEGAPQCDEATAPWVCQHRPRLLSCLPACGKPFVELACQLGLRAG